MFTMKKRKYISVAAFFSILCLASLFACQKELPQIPDTGKNNQEEPQRPAPEPKKEEGKKDEKVVFRLRGEVGIEALSFTDKAGRKHEIYSSAIDASEFKAVCMLRTEDATYVHRSVVLLEKTEQGLRLKETEIQLTDAKALDGKGWHAMFLVGGDWDAEYRSRSIKPQHHRLSQADVAKPVTLNLPLSTGWIALDPEKKGEEHSEAKALRLNFTSEGMVWVHELKAQQQSENLLLKRINWQGRGLAYGYTLSYTGEDLLKPITPEAKVATENHEQIYTFDFTPALALETTGGSSYVYVWGLAPYKGEDTENSITTLSAEGVFAEKTDDTFTQPKLFEIKVSDLASDKVHYLFSELNQRRPKPEPPVTPPAPPAPTPKDDVNESEYGALARANKTWWVHGVNVPEVSTWGFATVDAGLDRKGLTWQSDHGWYDINKERPTPGFGSKDSDLCWAAVASNTIHWWLEQNKSYLVRYGEYTGPKDYPDSFKSEIFKYYQKYFDNAGGDLKATYDWFFNGQYAGKTKIGGGHFKNVFGATRPTVQEGVRASEFSESLAKWLKQKHALAVMIEYPNRYLHVISVWGVEFDAAGKATHLYVTDSNDRDLEDQPSRIDYKNRQISKVGLVRMPIKLFDDGHVGMEGSIKNTYRFKIERLFAFPLLQDKWEEYLTRLGK